MIPRFADQADIQIRFQPFQLYPDLPPGDNQGVDKAEYFRQLHAMRDPHADPAVREQRTKERFQFLTEAWNKDGLSLAQREGKWGNSFDAQRLISFARKQGREDPMIEQIYAGNHEQNVPLSDRSFLCGAAERAGVQGAQEMLESEQEVEEVRAKIRRYVDMGINAVPVVMINDMQPLHGAPEPEVLAQAFSEIIARNSASASL